MDVVHGERIFVSLINNGFCSDVSDITIRDGHNSNNEPQQAREKLVDIVLLS
jgi:hypothetical protein